MRGKFYAGLSGEITEFFCTCLCTYFFFFFVRSIFVRINAVQCKQVDCTPAVRVSYFFESFILDSLVRHTPKIGETRTKKKNEKCMKNSNVRSCLTLHNSACCDLIHSVFSQVLQRKCEFTYNAKKFWNFILYR
jgi:hypothetical protein